MKNSPHYPNIRSFKNPLFLFLYRAFYPERFLVAVKVIVIAAFICSLQMMNLVSADAAISVQVFDQEEDADEHPLSNDPAVYVNEITGFYADFKNGNGDTIGRMLWQNDFRDIASGGLAVLDADNNGIVDQVIVNSGEYSELGLLSSFDAFGNPVWNAGTYSVSYDLGVGDFNGDGIKEVITAERSYRSRVINAQGQEIWNSGNLPDSHGMFALDVGNIDGDNAQEIAVADRNGEMLLIKPYVGFQCKYSLPGGDSPVNEVHFFDQEHDGVPSEVIGAYNQGHIVAMDKSCNFLWSYPELGNPYTKFYTAAVADLDHNGFKDDIIAATRYERLYRLDKEGNEIWEADTAFYAYALVVDDINNDGTEDIIVGGHSIALHDPDGLLVWEYEFSQDEEIYTLNAGDVTGDGMKEIVAGGSGGILYVLTADGELLWQYSSGGAIGTTYGGQPAIHIVDLNNDGLNEVVFSDSNGNIHALQDGDCQITYSDGQQSGMSWNSENGLWTHSRTFAQGGHYDWNVVCSKGNEQVEASSDVEIQNNAQPLIQELKIYPQTPTESDDLVCSSIVTDNNPGDNLSINVQWYKDDVLIASQENIDCQQGEYCASNPISNLEPDSTYHCVYTLTDGEAESQAEASVLVELGATVLESLVVKPSEHFASVYVTYSGDANDDAVFSVEFKNASDSSWQRGIDLVKGENANTYTGSLFFLDENQSYDLRIVVQDPGGVIGSAETHFSTTAMIWPEDQGMQFYVKPGVAGSDCDNSWSGLNENEPWCSLQFAHDQTQPGDTVHMLPGIYYEQLVIEHSGEPGKPISYVGEGEGVIIDGSNPDLLHRNWTPEPSVGDGVYSLPLDENVCMVIADDHERLFLHPTWDNFVDGSCWENDYVRPGCIEDGWFYRADQQKMYVKLPESMSDRDPSNHTMHINTYADCGTNGNAIKAYGDNWQNFRNFTIQYAHMGIHILDGHYIHASNIYTQHSKRPFQVRGQTTSNLVFEDNEMFDTKLYEWPWSAHKASSIHETTGFNIDYGYDIIVRNNVINGYANPLSVTGNDTDVYNNDVRNIADDGIEPEGSTVYNLRFINNTIDTMFDGLSLSPLKGLTYVIGNKFLNAQRYNMKIKGVDDSSGLKFYHNTIFSDYENYDEYVRGLSGSKHFVDFDFRNNIISVPGKVIEQDAPGDTSTELNNFDYNLLETRKPDSRFWDWNYPGDRLNNIQEVRDVLGFEMHGIEASPMLMDPNHGNVTPMMGSPAIDHGQFIPGLHCAVSDQYNPNQKYCYHWNGMNPDMGAVESVNIPPPPPEENESPYFHELPKIIDMDESESIEIELIAEDPNIGDTISISTVFVPAWVTTVDERREGNRLIRTIRLDPPANVPPSNMVLYKVQDQDGATGYVGFYVRVNISSVAPHFTSYQEHVYINAGSSMQWDSFAADADADETVHINVLNKPSWVGFFSWDGNPARVAIKCIPGVDISGDFIIRLQAVDVHGLHTEVVTTVTVMPVIEGRVSQIDNSPVSGVVSTQYPIDSEGQNQLKELPVQQKAQLTQSSTTNKNKKHFGFLNKLFSPK